MALVSSFLLLYVLLYHPLSAGASSCTDQLSFDHYIMLPPPGEYNSTDTSPMGCISDSNSLACGGSVLLGDGDIGSVDLDISTVFAWSETLDIVFSLTPNDRVQRINLFFHNEPQVGVGLPSLIELHWSVGSLAVPDNPLDYTILDNQDLSQSDESFRNVTLVVTTSDVVDYKFFRIHFGFPETSQINTLLLSEVQLCGDSVSVPVEDITFLENDEVIQLGPVDNVVASVELFCSVANEGRFQFDWTFPSSVSISQYLVRTADSTRTSIVQISQLSLDNGGDYVCHASYSSGKGESASRTIILDLRGTLQPLESDVMAVANEPVTLGCELYGYAEQSVDFTWQFTVTDEQLQSDSVYTISVERGNRSLQIGGDAPEASRLSLLTIHQANSSHTGGYICSASGMIRTLNLDVEVDPGSVEPPQTQPSPTQPPPAPSPTPDSSTPQPPAPREDSGNDTNLGLIIGVVVGALVVAIVIVTIVTVVMCIRRKKLHDKPTGHIYDYVEPPGLPPKRCNEINLVENAAYNHVVVPAHSNDVHASAGSMPATDHPSSSGCASVTPAAYEIPVPMQPYYMNSKQTAPETGIVSQVQS